MCMFAGEGGEADEGISTMGEGSDGFVEEVQPHSLGTSSAGAIPNKAQARHDADSDTQTGRLLGSGSPGSQQQGVCSLPLSQKQQIERGIRDAAMRIQKNKEEQAALVRQQHLDADQLAKQNAQLQQIERKEREEKDILKRLKRQQAREQRRMEGEKKARELQELQRKEKQQQSEQQRQS